MLATFKNLQYDWNILRYVRTENSMIYEMFPEDAEAYNRWLTKQEDGGDPSPTFAAFLSNYERRDKVAIRKEKIEAGSDPTFHQALNQMGHQPGSVPSWVNRRAPQEKNFGLR